jgi:hypothetical protein
MSARKRLGRWRFRTRDRLCEWRWRAIAAILNRFATAEMRHAALMLGCELALGYGREGFLGHLREFHVGFTLGDGIRYGEEDTGLDPVRAAEMFRLERSLFGITPELVTR